jgi:PAS domain S-box-containing protein
VTLARSPAGVGSNTHAKQQRGILGSITTARQRLSATRISASHEGQRQQQGLDVNTLVPGDGQHGFSEEPQVLKTLACAAAITLACSAPAGAQAPGALKKTDIGEAVYKSSRIADMLPQQTHAMPTFDDRQLRRWGIRHSQLPAGSNVRFQQPGFWERYWGYVIAALAFAAVQTAFIAALLVQRSLRRKTEERNQAILDVVPDLMFLQSRNGVYLDYHAPDRRMLFMPPEQFLGRNMRDILPPDLVRKLEPAFERTAASRSATIVEYALPMSGGERHYEARIVPSGTDLMSIVRDVTERKRSEIALRDSLERHALATAAGSVGVWDWNLETNEIYVDPALKAILGFEDHEIRNHLDDWGRRVHPDDASDVMARAQEHIDGKGPTYEIEHRMLHKDGSIRWFLARGSVVRREDGTPARVLGTDMDITAQKESERALQEAHMELARVSRLTALGEFAASIAHEVSQPLTAIVMNAKTCLRWLASDAPDVPEIRAALNDVVESGKRADEIIRRNRELFQHHAVEKLPVDINSVIREVAVFTRSHLQHSHVALEIDLASALPTVLGDRVELQQVLLNLIRNATDAMASLDPSSRRLKIETRLTDKAAVQVTVSDSGIGLGGVDLKRMFTSSYTTKADGTGVGLSVCRSIVEAHGGRLWAVQNDQRGATFSFMVPVPSPAEPTSPAATPVAVAEPSLHG